MPLSGQSGKERKWFELTQYATITWACYSVWPIMVNLKFWNSLPKEIQQVFNDARRDHWNFCYSILLAGGGIRPGYVFGASDKLGAFPADRPVTPGDINATLYHVLGVDHRRQLYDSLARPHRIVPNGDVVEDLLAQLRPGTFEHLTKRRAVGVSPPVSEYARFMHRPAYAGRSPEGPLAGGAARRRGVSDFQKPKQKPNVVPRGYPPPPQGTMIREWRFTVTKTNSPHIVPLATQAVSILRELHALTGEGHGPAVAALPSCSSFRPQRILKTIPEYLRMQETLADPRSFCDHDTIL